MKEVTQCSEMITSDSKPTHSFIFIIKHPHFFSLPPDSEVTLLGLISDILGISSWLSFDSVVPDILLTLSAQRPTCSWKPWQNSLLQLIKSLFFFFPSGMYDFTVPHLDYVSLLNIIIWGDQLNLLLSHMIRDILEWSASMNNRRIITIFLLCVAVKNQ